METLNLDLTQRYTYSDYITWADNVRRELIEGFIKLMSPAPARVHQKLSIKLASIFEFYLRKKKCEVYSAPFDVRLPDGADTNNNAIFTVVQPDICVICDPAKLDDRGCIGAPDLIIEILSPQNIKYDLKVKYALYEKHLVKEYWIVSPHDEYITIYLLNDQKKYYQAGVYAEDDKIPVAIFNGGLEIDLTEVFSESKI